MHEKLLGEGTKDPESGGILPFANGARTVTIPQALTESALIGASAEQVDALIREMGAALGLAALVKLAAGHGETPASAQVTAAKFLVERGADLVDNDNLARGDRDAMRRMSQSELDALIARLEDEAKSRPVISDAEIIETL